MVLNSVQLNTNCLHGGSSDLWPGGKEALNHVVIKLGMSATGSWFSQMSGHGYHDGNDLAGCSC